VVPNDGTTDELVPYIEACWEWIKGLESAKQTADPDPATAS